jgi:polyhydroxybutyrate depolymerase
MLSTMAMAILCAAPDAGFAADGGRRLVFGGDRPVTLSVPAAYDPRHPAPLVLMLHGYGSTGPQHEAYFGLSGLVEAHGVLLAAPDGTLDAQGNRFWDARTDACCNFTGHPVDDVKYLRALLAEIRAVYRVDPHRVFVVGHSNGGFMAHRLGCELSKEISAVVSLAGTASATPSGCHASTPVSVLQIHGDRDVGVRLDGGTNILGKGGGAYAGAVEMTARWARDDGCKSTRSPGAPIDLDSKLAGEETTVSSFDGCRAGSDVTLWTIQGGGHVPAVATNFADLVWRWLEAHPRK